MRAGKDEPRRHEEHEGEKGRKNFFYFASSLFVLFVPSWFKLSAEGGESDRKGAACAGGAVEGVLHCHTAFIFTARWLLLAARRLPRTPDP